MNPLDILKDEHEQVELELLELEEVMNGDVINYPNLIHTFKGFCNLWNRHENKEEKAFTVFDKENIKVPVEKMTCEHRDLRGHIKKVVDALKSGSEEKVRDSFEEIVALIEKVRKHKKDEDEVLYTIAEDEFSKGEWDEIEKALADAQL